MPEIEVVENTHKQTEFALNLLKHEESQSLRKTISLVSEVNSILKHRTDFEKMMGKGADTQKAEDLIADLMPREEAKTLIQAFINNEVNTKAILSMIGSTDKDGFAFQKIEFPKTP